MSSSVPVLLITGPVGVGKASTAVAVSWLLSQQEILHACVDLPQISRVFPERDDDPWNERLAHRNLASMWQNFRGVGVERLIVTRVLETRPLIRRIEDAVPARDIQRGDAVPKRRLSLRSPAGHSMRSAFAKRR